MAAKVGSLMIDIGANVARLQRDMGKANNEISKFRKQTESQFQKVAKAANTAVAVFGGIAAIKGLASFVKQTLDFADSTAKMAAKVGVTTDYLQEMRFVAEQTGVAQDALETSLQRFTRRLGEAAQGTGELLPVLKQYGIAVTDSEGRARSSEAVLNDLADTIKETKSPMEALRVAVKAFDAEGAVLVNTMRKGSAGIGELREEIRDAGGVVESEFLEAAERANDALSKMDQVIRASVIRAVSRLDGAIIDLAYSIISNKDEIQSLAYAFFDIAKTGIIAAAAIVKVIGATISGYKQLADLGAQTLYGPDTPAGQTNEQIKKLDARQARIKKTLDDITANEGRAGMVDVDAITAEYDRNAKELGNLKKTLENMTPEDFDPASDLARKRKEVEDEVAKWGAVGYDLDKVGGGGGGGGKSKGRGGSSAEKEANEAKRAMEDRLKFQQDLTDKLNRLTMSHYDYEKWALDQQVSEWRTKYGEMNEIAAYHAAQVEELNKEAFDSYVQESNTALAGAHRMLSEYAAEFGDTSKNVADAAAGMFDVVMTAWYDFTTGADMDFKDLLRSMAAEISKFAMNQFLFGPISEMLSGMTGSSLLNLFTGGGGAPTAVGFLGGKAAGGHVRPGGLYRVGESGPEYLKMGGRGGEIIPNSEMGGRPAMVFNFNQTVRTPDMRGFSESKSQIMAQASVAMRHASRNL